MQSLTFTRVPDQDAGEPVIGRYFERYHLPLLGPTGLLLMRYLAEAVAEGPYEVSVVELAGRLGVKASVLHASLKRLQRFDLLRRTHLPDRLGVRTRVTPLEERQVARLPAPLAAQHREMMALLGSHPVDA